MLPFGATYIRFVAVAVAAVVIVKGKSVPVLN
jgi:hypothetical protein